MSNFCEVCLDLGKKSNSAGYHSFRHRCIEHYAYDRDMDIRELFENGIKNWEANENFKSEVYKRDSEYCPEYKEKEITEKDDNATTKMYIDSKSVEELLGRVQLLEQQMNSIINIAINEEKMMMQIKNIADNKEEKL